MTICALITLLGLAATPAADAARGGKTFSAGRGVGDTCGEGATCTQSAESWSDGRQVVRSTIDRAEPSFAKEYSTGQAHAATTIRLTAPVTELRVTFTWYVTHASGRAVPRSAEGATVARLFARGSVRGCDACVLTYETDDAPTATSKGRYVVNAYANAVEAEASLDNRTVTHTVVLHGPNGGAVPTGLYVATGTADAFTASWPACNADDFGGLPGLGDDGCIPEVVGHAGHAEVEGSLKLLSIVAAT